MDTEWKAWSKDKCERNVNIFTLANFTASILLAGNDEKTPLKTGTGLFFALNTSTLKI